MIKRFDGANWVDISGGKRWDGSNWIQVSSAKRWDGANWAECLLTLQQIKDNLLHIGIYHKMLQEYSGYTEFDITHSRTILWYIASPSWERSKIEALIGFKMVMKNGIEYEIDRKLLNMLNCKVYLDVSAGVSGTTMSEADNTAQITYCGRSFYTNPSSKESGMYLPEAEEALTIGVYCSAETFATHNSQVTIGTRTQGMHLKSLSTGEIVTLPMDVVYYSPS